MGVLAFFFRHDDVKALEQQFAFVFLLGVLGTFCFLISWFSNGTPKPEDFDLLSEILAISSFILFSFATMSTTVLPRMVQKLSKNQPSKVSIPYLQTWLVTDFYKTFILAFNSFLLILIIVKYASLLDTSIHARLSEVGFLKGANAIIMAGIILEILVDVGCFIVLGCGIKSNPMMFCIIIIELILTILLIVTTVMNIDFTSIFFQPTLVLGLALSLGHIFAHAINR